MNIQNDIIHKFTKTLITNYVVINIINYGLA